LKELLFSPPTVLGPHLRAPNPGFNLGFTPHICYIKGAMIDF
jgi:hypothetical protein